MTDLERGFLDQLTTAAWPLWVQVVFAFVLMAGYFIWSRIYYHIVDPILRTRIGANLGVGIIWVRRHSRDYPTPFEFGWARYRQWSWGIAMEHERTFLRDGLVVALSLLVVNVLAGLWPIAIFLLAFLGLKALSYVVFLPLCVAMLATYAVFWSGKYEVAGMH